MESTVCCTASLAAAEHEPCDVLRRRRWILLITRGFKQTAGDVAHVTQQVGEGETEDEELKAPHPRCGLWKNKLKSHSGSGGHLVQILEK